MASGLASNIPQIKRNLDDEHWLARACEGAAANGRIHLCHRPALAAYDARAIAWADW